MGALCHCICFVCLETPLHQRGPGPCLTSTIGYCFLLCHSYKLTHITNVINYIINQPVTKTSQRNLSSTLTLIYHRPFLDWFILSLGIAATEIRIPTTTPRQTVTLHCQAVRHRSPLDVIGCQTEDRVWQNSRQYNQGVCDVNMGPASSSDGGLKVLAPSCPICLQHLLCLLFPFWQILN